jgi:hypothetical protein
VAGAPARLDVANDFFIRRATPSTSGSSGVPARIRDNGREDIYQDV